MARDRANHGAVNAIKKLWHELEEQVRIASGPDDTGRSFIAQRSGSAVSTEAPLSFTFFLLGSGALWRDAGLVDQAFAEDATSLGEHM